MENAYKTYRSQIKIEVKIREHSLPFDCSVFMVHDTCSLFSTFFTLLECRETPFLTYLHNCSIFFEISKVRLQSFTRATTFSYTFFFEKFIIMSYNAPEHQNMGVAITGPER